MSKKRFTDGMNSLFDSLDDDAAQEPRPKSAKSDKEPASSRSSGKDFSSDLQSFLQEAFDESLEKQLAERQETPSPRPRNTRVKKRSRRPMGGLDSLIRSTVDMEPEESRPSRNVRRVTLTFDPDKLDKLKSIARNQRTYLRDVIDQIVADYLDRYENGEGE